MGLKIRPPMLRNPLRVAVCGFDVGDGRIVLVDKNGKTVGAIESSNVGQPTQLAMARLEWDAAFDKMLQKFSYQQQRCAWLEDAWGRKIQSWCRQQWQHRRIASHNRFFTTSKRKNWDDAIRCMWAQFKNAEHKAKLKSDRWNQWAETVSRNHRRKGTGMATRKQFRELIDKQSCQCAATAVELTPASASLDHKKPRSHGGTNDIGNLHIIHDIVNRSKADMDWPDFVAMCHAVARQHADTRTAWWTSIDRRRAAGPACDDAREQGAA